MSRENRFRRSLNLPPAASTRSRFLSARQVRPLCLFFRPWPPGDLVDFGPVAALPEKRSSCRLGTLPPAHPPNGATATDTLIACWPPPIATPFTGATSV